MVKERTVPGILVDHDVEGQVKILVGILTSDVWKELWTSLNCPVRWLQFFGLDADASDLVVWQTCQNHQIVLVTGNRNQRSPESLEAVILNSNTPECLPVITLANQRRIPHDRPYAERTAERLLDYLMNIENLRGTGRLYVP